MAKVTKLERFKMVESVLIEAGADEGLVEFVRAEQALLEKRAGKARGKTKTQIENEGIKENIVQVLESVEDGVTATDIALTIGESVQRTSALLKQLVDAGRVTRTEGKGKTKTLFSV